MVKSILECSIIAVEGVFIMDDKWSFNIGICDDESKWHKAVSETCQKYLAEKNISFEIFSYYEGAELFKEKEKEIDVLFLDVEMEAMDGLTVMKEVEKMSNIHNIIFVSSHPEAVWDSFGYKTKGFVTKPFEDKDIFDKLDEIYSKKLTDALMDFTDYNGVVYFKKSDIVLIKSDSNYSTIITEDGEKVVTCTLKDCEKKLDGLPFLRIHRSYIVNLDYVKNMTSSVVMLKNGESYTIGRSYRNQVKTDYQAYLRRELHL